MPQMSGPTVATGYDLGGWRLATAMAAHPIITWQRKTSNVVERMARPMGLRSRKASTAPSEDRHHANTIIGTATTTLRELTGGATSQLAAPFKLELTLMVRGSRDDNAQNQSSRGEDDQRRTGTLEITVDVLDGD